MVLIRLEHHEHPAPPQHEMRQKAVHDSGDEIVGTVANLYVDEDSRQLRFEVVTLDLEAELLAELRRCAHQGIVSHMSHRFARGLLFPA
jgi:hypothetical protein